MTAFKTNGATGNAYAWTSEVLSEIQRALDAPAPASDIPYLHYRGRAFARLAWSFRELPILSAFLTASARMFEAIEQAAWDVHQMQQVDNAVGFWVLRLGKLIRAPTLEIYSDETNRALIKFWSAALAAGQSWAAVLPVVEILYRQHQIERSDDMTVAMALWDPTPAAVEIGQTAAVELVQTLFSGGTHFDTMLVVEDEHALFFEDDADPETPGTYAGFSDGEVTTGAPLAFG